ncbi:response regulator transcription factor [Eggerthella sp. YY7918]|uniref:response regulator transcription factor n=1 Tax=Eggerthella sp. (strain YY7918) TaxID=502558 RepID=UPI000217101C|nr:LuxR family transcriptional regulator [Eggerthella sp. YY7918]BAK43787.1 hypothetical protein EGYY_05740 [Eggerthella sp. YY7918]
MGQTARPTLLTRLTAACATIEKTLKLRYLGIGFVWAWIYCSFETSALFPERQGISINADPSWMASAATVVVVLLASGLAWRSRDLSCMRAVRWAAPILVAAGTVLSAVAALMESFEVLQYISGILSGIGSGWLCILWADALSHLEIEQIEVVVPAASLVTLLCTLVFPYIQGIPGVLAVASLPLASGALLFLSYRGVKKGTTPSAVGATSPHSQRPRQHALTTIMRASIMLCATYFAIGCMGALRTSTDLLQTLWGFDVATFIGSSFGIAMALFFILYTIHIDFTSLFRWLTPLLILALALCPWQEVLPNFVSTTIFAIADTSMQIIVYLYIISLAKQGGVSVALGIGITQGFIQLGVLMGNVTGVTVSDLVANGTLNVFVLVLSLICLVSFTSLLIPQRSTKPAGILEAPMPEETETSHIGLLCRELSINHGLSTRETEILEYLARGRSQPYIREELILSKNTVATHVKHIYQKLNVHSRQELLDLFEQ